MGSLPSIIPCHWSKTIATRPSRPTMRPLWMNVFYEWLFFLWMNVICEWMIEWMNYLMYASFTEAEPFFCWKNAWFWYLLWMRNQPTNRPTDTAYYRDARTHLKTTKSTAFWLRTNFSVTWVFLSHFINFQTFHLASFGDCSSSELSWSTASLFHGFSHRCEVPSRRPKSFVIELLIMTEAWSRWSRIGVEWNRPFVLNGDDGDDRGHVNVRQDFTGV